MEKLGKWSIRNNVTVNLIMVFIILAGIFTVMNMRREMFPQFSLDMINVSVMYPGSSPEEVEEGIWGPDGIAVPLPDYLDGQGR